MEINSSKLYWAGLRNGTGPWPLSACAARAKRRSAAAWQGFGPRPLCLAGLASRGEAPCRGARWRGGAARPAASGRLRPRQRQRASAGDARGESELDKVAMRGWRGKEKGRSTAAVHRGAMDAGGEARGGPTCARKAEQVRARLRGRRGGARGTRNWRMVRWCLSWTPAELERGDGRARSSRLWRRRGGSAGRE